MIVVSCVLAAALVVVVVSLVREHRKAVERLTGAHRASEEAWIVERRELTNRVQAPDRIPVALRPAFEPPELEVDESNLVGTVNYDQNGD